MHQRGVACLARWGLRAQVVATHSPLVTRFAGEGGPFTIAGTVPPGDGKSLRLRAATLLILTHDTLPLPLWYNAHLTSLLLATV